MNFYIFAIVGALAVVSGGTTKADATGGVEVTEDAKSVSKRGHSYGSFRGPASTYFSNNGYGGSYVTGFSDNTLGDSSGEQKYYTSGAVAARPVVTSYTYQQPTSYTYHTRYQPAYPTRTNYGVDDGLSYSTSNAFRTFPATSSAGYRYNSGRDTSQEKDLYRNYGTASTYNGGYNAFPVATAAVVGGTGTGAGGYGYNQQPSLARTTYGYYSPATTSVRQVFATQPVNTYRSSYQIPTSTYHSGSLGLGSTYYTTGGGLGTGYRTAPIRSHWY